MKEGTKMKKWAAMISLVILGSGLSACAMGGASWKEEVLLQDGSKIVVARSVERGGRREPGKQPPIKEQSLNFTLPGTNENVTWKSQYSEDIGLADFQPLLLDISNRMAYMVVVPVGCLSYNKWGRPNPPYVIFKYQDKAWNRISLQDLPAEINSPNLIFSSPDNEVEKLGKSFVTVAMVQHANSDLTQPQFKTIMRETIPGGRQGQCPEMVPYGNGGWLGLDWFSDQPTYEACLKFCEKKSVSPSKCPCTRFFEGE
jgi:hypothetical protein